MKGRTPEFPEFRRRFPLISWRIYILVIVSAGFEQRRREASEGEADGVVLVHRIGGF
jgi:hypothetical protein